jgi:RNA polymerase sigma-54 factor
LWFVVLVRDHLNAVAAADPAGPAAALGIPRADVEAAFELVRTSLHPPLLAGRSEPGGPVPPAPDVFVDLVDGGLAVRVVDSAGLGLALVPVNRSVSVDVEAARWAARHRADARRLLHQLDARADVLLRVARFAVERQSDFVLRGPAAHVPLTRAEVAAGTGLHPSTVSRAVMHAVMRYPDGRTSPLAVLFGGATAMEDLMVRLLAERPMSDARLRDRLAAHGHDLARRTVAKHRIRLGLPADGRRG